MLRKGGLDAPSQKRVQHRVKLFREVLNQQRSAAAHTSANGLLFKLISCYSLPLNFVHEVLLALTDYLQILAISVLDPLYPLQLGVNHKCSLDWYNLLSDF